MEKKAKIIATLGPAIYSDTKLKKLIDLGVDAFRINFSHNTNGISKIVSRIRKIEKNTKKKIPPYQIDYGGSYLLINN